MEMDFDKAGCFGCNEVRHESGSQLSVVVNMVVRYKPTSITTEEIYASGVLKGLHEARPVSRKERIRVCSYA